MYEKGFLQSMAPVKFWSQSFELFQTTFLPRRRFESFEITLVKLSLHCAKYKNPVCKKKYDSI